MRQIVPHKVRRTVLELQDYDSIMLDEWTMINLEFLFRINKQEVLPYEKFDNTWVSVSIEMDLDVMQYERQVYTVLDMLSDVGGLTGILMTVLGTFVATWNHNSFDNFMVSRLFKI